MSSFGLGFVFVPMALVALHNVAEQDSGVASSLLNAAQQVGGAVGLALLGTVAWTAVANSVRTQVAHAARQAGQPVPKLGTAPPASIYNHALTVGFSRAFDVAAGIGLLALLIGIVTIRVSRQELAGAVPAPQQPAPQPTALQPTALQPTALQPTELQPTALQPTGTAAHGTAAHGTAAHGTAANRTAANRTAAHGTAANRTAARDRAAARGPSRPRRGRPSLPVLLAAPAQGRSSGSPSPPWSTPAARIDDGTYPPRAKLPSEVTLVQETGFARDTGMLGRCREASSGEDSARRVTRSLFLRYPHRSACG